MKTEHIFLAAVVTIIGLVVIFGSNSKKCKSVNMLLKSEFTYIKSNSKGIFYELKNTSSNPYPWITARVDIDSSNEEWENSVINLMKKHGWKNHPNETKNLCKDGSKLILEHIDYKNKSYQFVSLLHDDFTAQECK